MTAHRATKKPHFALVSCPELAEPPDGEVVFALGTFYLDRRHGPEAFTLFIDNHDLLFLAFSCVSHLVSSFNLAYISAFTAFQLASRRNQHTLAFRTEHRYSMRKQRRLTLLSE